MTGPSHGSIDDRLDALGALVAAARSAAFWDAFTAVQGMPVAEVARVTAVHSRNVYPVLTACGKRLRDLAVREGSTTDPAITAAWLRRLADHLDPAGRPAA